MKAAPRIDKEEVDLMIKFSTDTKTFKDLPKARKKLPEFRIKTQLITTYFENKKMKISRSVTRRCVIS